MAEAKLKSVAEKYMNTSANIQSPVQEDLMRVVKHDEEGNEFVSYVPVDGEALIKSNGNALAWSLNSLIAAGINPDFPISTGYGTRLEGIGAVIDAAAQINSILDEVEAPSPKSAE